MLRRSIISVAGGVTLGAALPVLGQTPQRVYRIGVLSESVPLGRLAVLRLLPELGYVEGRNLVIDYKFAEGRVDLLPSLAAELVAAKPDLILGLLNREVEALKRATSTIPIVMLFVTAPDQTGLVASLARPGGNITGTTTNAPELAGKMTQILRDTLPGMSRLTWLNDPDYPGMALYMKSTEQAARAMGLRLAFLAVRTSADLDAAFLNLERNRPDAIGIATAGALLDGLGRIVEFAARHKMPALYSIEAPVLNGGLMSYAADFGAMGQRNAAMIDKIFKGIKPSDIPVEEPAKFLLTINMKTARALGLTIPQSVLLQATKVIE